MLPNIPQGAEFKVFCSFQCTNEASGDIEVELIDQGEVVVLPICTEHAERYTEINSTLGG